MKKLRRVLLTAKIDSEYALSIANKIYDILSSIGVETLVEREVAWRLNIKNGVYIKDANVDAVVIVGGNGTILKVANEIKEKDIPILTVNAGIIGFLSELDPEDIYKIPEIINGEYNIRECTRIKATIKRLFKGDQLIKNVERLYPVKDALNEISIVTSIPSKVINLKVKIGEEEFLKSRGDGMIISTTTGATAYSLSAGGPIIDPNLDVFIITLLSPLMLINRSIVVPTNTKIEVELCSEGVDAYMSVDGRDHMYIPVGTLISLEKSEFTTKIISTREKGFYKKLKRRLQMEL